MAKIWKLIKRIMLNIIMASVLQMLQIAIAMLLAAENIKLAINNEIKNARSNILK